MNENPVFEGFNQTKTVDFAISAEKGKYLVDVFDVNITDTNKAYIETISYTSLEEAKADMQHYIFRNG